MVELISGRKETSELSQNARSNQRETSAIRSAAVELPSLYSALCYEVRAAERVKRPLFDVIIATWLLPLHFCYLFSFMFVNFTFRLWQSTTVGSRGFYIPTPFLKHSKTCENVSAHQSNWALKMSCLLKNCNSQKLNESSWIFLWFCLSIGCPKNVANTTVWVPLYYFVWRGKRIRVAIYDCGNLFTICSITRIWNSLIWWKIKGDNQKTICTSLLAWFLKYGMCVECNCRWFLQFHENYHLRSWYLRSPIWSPNEKWWTSVYVLCRPWKTEFVPPFYTE